MKRILAMALSVILIATLAISGTVAYLTDDESEINVMTVGKVNIKLHEEQRTEINPAPSAAPDLETFEDFKNMMPITEDGNGNDGWGMDTRSNYIDKIVRVENTGESDAWVRVFVAIPSELDKDINGQGPALHWQTGAEFNEFDDHLGDKDFSYEFEADVTKNLVGENVALEDEEGKTQNYNIYLFTRKNILVAKDTDTDSDMSAAVIVGAYLDAKVDYDDVTDSFYLGEKVASNLIKYDLDEDIRIPVYVQAIQAAGFETANDAFKASGLSTNPWASNNNTMTETDEPASVSSVAELEAAIEAAKAAGQTEVTLTDSLSSNEAVIVRLPGGMTLNGNNKTLTNIQIRSNNDGGDIIIKNTKFVGTANFGDADMTFIMGYYSHALGNLTVENCVFDGCYYNAVQFDNQKTAGATVTIQNNVFNADAADRPVRINAKSGINTNAVIDGNTFNDTANYERGWASVTGPVNVTGNYPSL